jgi:hypothetical protein
MLLQLLYTNRYHIPAQTGLWTPWATIHNVDANWGPTAGQYLPERWLQPGSEYMQSPAAEEADERNGSDGSGGDLKHATASTARNFEMGVSRVKVSRCACVRQVKLHLWHHVNLHLCDLIGDCDTGRYRAAGQAGWQRMSSAP